MHFGNVVGYWVLRLFVIVVVPSVSYGSQICIESCCFLMSHHPDNRLYLFIEKSPFWNEERQNFWPCLFVSCISMMMRYHYSTGVIEMHKYILILMILVVTCLAAISLVSKYAPKLGIRNKKKVNRTRRLTSSSNTHRHTQDSRYRFQLISRDTDLALQLVQSSLPQMSQ